jgi:hypothetical protein
MNTAINEANLQDISADSLKTHVPHLLARDTKDYLVEYGIRLDDKAMVFHFFSPKDAAAWDPASKMDQRLKAAIDQCFQVKNVTAGFAPELDSFYVIVGGLGAALDPWPLVDRFFRVLDAPQAGS